MQISMFKAPKYCNTIADILSNTIYLEQNTCNRLFQKPGLSGAYSGTIPLDYQAAIFGMQT